MIEYIYVVKCDGCEDEMFNFFTDARMQCDLMMSKHPTITQIEVERNDFGECTDSHDLGTVWSWEDVMKETEEESAKSIFTRDDLKDYAPDCDPEFDSIDNSVDFEVPEPVTSEVTAVDDIPDNSRKPVTEAYNFDDKFNIAGFSVSVKDEFEDEGIKGYNLVYSRNGIDIVEVEVWEEASPVTVNANLYAPNIMDSYYDSFDSFAADLIYKADKYLKESKRIPVPEGMTIKELVEEMEENEDTVECTWCEELFDKDQCRYEVNLGWLCSRCEAAIKSRGETLTFREGSYWDFLDEDTEKPIDEDLDWHTYKITFTTKANPDKEQTTTFKTWQSDVEYAWRKSNANIPNTTIKNIELVEDLNQETKTWTCVFDGQEIGTVEATTEEEAYLEMEYKYPEYNYGLYDGVAVVYPANNNLETLEESDTYSKHLADCPECGATKSFDHETGICIECGFSV